MTFTSRSGAGRLKKNHGQLGSAQMRERRHAAADLPGTWPSHAKHLRPAGLTGPERADRGVSILGFAVAAILMLLAIPEIASAI